MNRINERMHISSSSRRKPGSRFLIARRALGLAFILCLPVSGCSSIKEDLGLTHRTPDEFAVVKHAPLELPPSLELPAPRPGSSRPQESDPEEQAIEALLGTKSPATASRPQESRSEAALLEKVDAHSTPEDIRAVVDEETETLRRENIPVAKKLLNVAREQEAPAIVVDAEKEAARIKAILEAGETVTGAQTPLREE